MPEKRYSDLTVILCFIFCWPLGVYMIIANNLSSQKQLNQNSATASYMSPQSQTAQAVKPRKYTGLKVIGWFLFAIGILFLLTTLPDLDCSDSLSAYSITGLVFSLLFLGFGISMISIASKQAKKSKVKCRYVEIINNASGLSIREIAHKAGDDEAFALKIIAQLLKENYFPHCYIDYDFMEFCFPKVKDARKYNFNTVGVKCECCGAKNTLISGTVAECDYCGMPLKADTVSSSQAVLNRANEHPPPAYQAPAQNGENSGGILERIFNRLFR